MGCAPAPGVRLAAYESGTSQVCEGGDLAITEGYVDMLALSGSSSPQKSSHDRVGCVQSRGQIGHSNADFNGWTIS